MRIFDLKNEDGQVVAFEVSNALLGRKAACRLVGSIPGVKVRKAPKGFRKTEEDEFCEFEVDGQTFKLWEPFGDNSRYWVGPEPVAPCPQLQKVRETFARHGLFGIRRG